MTEPTPGSKRKERNLRRRARADQLAPDRAAKATDRTRADHRATRSVVVARRRRARPWFADAVALHPRASRAAPSSGRGVCAGPGRPRPAGHTRADGTGAREGAPCAAADAGRGLPGPARTRHADAGAHGVDGRRDPEPVAWRACDGLRRRPHQRAGHGLAALARAMRPGRRRGAGVLRQHRHGHAAQPARRRQSLAGAVRQRVDRRFNRAAAFDSTKSTIAAISVSSSRTEAPDSGAVPCSLHRQLLCSFHFCS